MKKIHAVVAVVMSAILALSLTACGTQAVTSEPAPQPTVEASAEVAEPAPEPVKEPEVEAPSEEPEVVEEPTEEPATEEATEEPEEAEEPEEVDPMEALMESNMGEYVSDGVFDVEKFAEDTGASRQGTDESTFILVYEDWFVMAGKWAPESGDGFVAVGKWEGADVSTYSYLFPKGNDVTINCSDTELKVPIESIIHLRDIINSVAKNGPDVAPDVPSTNFKPCDPNDATIQY